MKRTKNLWPARSEAGFAGIVRAAAYMGLSFSIGCADEFTSVTVLEDLRILGVVAEPLELGPTDVLEARAVVVAPPESLVELTASFCPLTTGSRGGFVCAAPACETPLTVTSSGSVSVLVGPALLSCAEKVGIPVNGQGGTPDPGLSFDTQLRFRATDGVTEREAVERVAFYPAGPSARNKPPRVRGLEIEGVATSTRGPAGLIKEGDERVLRLTLDPGEVFTDVAGRERAETFVVSWYSTQGTFDTSRTDDDLVSGVPESENTFKAEDLDLARPLDIWIGVRDGRGGQTFLGPISFEVTGP